MHIASHCICLMSNRVFCLFRVNVQVVRDETGWRAVSQVRSEQLRDVNNFYYYRIKGLDANAFYRVELSATNKIGNCLPLFVVVRRCWSLFPLFTFFRTITLTERLFGRRLGALPGRV